MDPRLLVDLDQRLVSWTPSGEKEWERRAIWRELASDPQTLTRHGRPSHFTASALPIAESGEAVCLVHHRRIDLWVQPGGHFEPKDSSVPAAAGREMREETGLEGRIDAEPLLLSRHRAPCGVGRWHLDLQMLAVTATNQPVVSSESLDVAWFDIDHLPSDMAPGVPDLIVAARRRLSRSGPPRSRLPEG